MCNGVQLQNADGSRITQKNNDMYVDDTDNWAGTTTCTQMTAQYTVSQSQTAAQAWSDILATLGGAVAFPKCKWSALTWIFPLVPQNYTNIHQAESP